MTQYSCSRGHQWSYAGAAPIGVPTCYACSMEDQREIQKANIAAPIIKEAVADALREFFPELVKALRDARSQ